MSEMTRRELLCRSGMGMGALLLGELMGQAGRLLDARDGANLHPLAPRR